MQIGLRTDLDFRGSGLFYCPKCKQQQQYMRFHDVRRSFTALLFWRISQSPGKVLRDYIQCTKCHGGFDARILQVSTQRILKLVAEADDLLKSSLGFAEVRAQLVQKCGSAQLADRVLQLALETG